MEWRHQKHQWRQRHNSIINRAKALAAHLRHGNGGQWHHQMVKVAGGDGRNGMDRRYHHGARIGHNMWRQPRMAYRNINGEKS